MNSYSDIKKYPTCGIVVTYDPPSVDSDLENPSLVELSQSVKLTHACTTDARLLGP